MSDKSYREIYPKMSKEMRDAMHDLYMTGINNDGHVWVTYGNVEQTVARILREVYKID